MNYILKFKTHNENKTQLNQLLTEIFKRMSSSVVRLIYRIKQEIKPQKSN